MSLKTKKGKQKYLKLKIEELKTKIKDNEYIKI